MNISIKKRKIFIFFHTELRFTTVERKVLNGEYQRLYSKIKDSIFIVSKAPWIVLKRVRRLKRVWVRNWKNSWYLLRFIQNRRNLEKELSHLNRISYYYFLRTQWINKHQMEVAGCFLGENDLPRINWSSKANQN